MIDNKFHFSIVKITTRKLNQEGNRMKVISMIIALLLSIAALFAFGIAVNPDGKSYATESHSVVSSAVIPASETAFSISFAIGLIAFIAFASAISFSSSLAAARKNKTSNQTRNGANSDQTKVFEVGWRGLAAL
jgi:hypothetical protein